MWRPSHIVWLVAVAASLAVGPAMAETAAGQWLHQVIANDGDVLTYSDGGKVTFYLGCGRGFALAVRYPGEAKPDGPAIITLATAKGRLSLKGVFEQPIAVSEPAPMTLATTFRQTYLGYAKRDPRVFGAAWNAEKARLLDILDSKGPITIAADQASYQLPAIVAGDWHRALKLCRN